MSWSLEALATKSLAYYVILGSYFILEYMWNKPRFFALAVFS